MKHVVHLVRTDVRRFRLLLAAWMLIHVADAVMRGIRPALAGDQRLAAPLELLASVLYAVKWLGTIVLVPLAVQTHPLVGSDAFWMTRPIPWRALFTAKILLLGLALVAVPGVCEVFLMVAFRVEAADGFRVALHTALLQSLLLFGIMTLSTLTSNLARFALALGGVLVGVVLLLNMLLAVAIRNLAAGPELSTVSSRTSQSSAPVVTMLILLTAAAITLVIVQYRTRSRWRAVAAGLTSLAVVILFTVFWPWRTQPLPVPEWATRTSALQLVGESRQGEFRPFEQPSILGDTTSWQIGNVRARIRAIEQSWTATARLAESSIEFEDRTHVTTAGNGLQSPVHLEAVDDSPLHLATRHVLAVDRVMHSAALRYSVEGVPSIPGIVMSGDAFRAHSGRSGTYHGRFLVDLEEMRVASVLPLEVGAEFRDRGFRIVIEQVVPQDRTVIVKVRQVTTRTMFDAEAFPRLSFYLRNRDRSEAAAGSIRGAMIGGQLPPLWWPMSYGFSVAHGSAAPGSGFAVTASFLQFPELYPPGQPTLDLNAAWLSGAEFVVIRADAAGSVVRTLEIPDFQIAEAPPRSPQ